MTLNLTPLSALAAILVTINLVLIIKMMRIPPEQTERRASYLKAIVVLVGGIMIISAWS